MAPIYLNASSYVSFLVPNLDGDLWNEINKDLKSKLSNLHHRLSLTEDDASIQSIGNDINVETHQFIAENKDIFETKESKPTTKQFRQSESKLLSKAKAVKKL